MESASSRPEADLMREANSGVDGRERAKIPKAIFQLVMWELVIIETEKH
jgi:hypothetical protein